VLGNDSHDLICREYFLNIKQFTGKVRLIYLRVYNAQVYANIK